MVLRISRCSSDDVTSQMLLSDAFNTSNTSGIAPVQTFNPLETQLNRSRHGLVLVLHFHAAHSGSERI